jgi:hypothetical protein
VVEAKATATGHLVAADCDGKVFLGEVKDNALGLEQAKKMIAFCFNDRAMALYRI